MIKKNKNQAKQICYKTVSVTSGTLIEDSGLLSVTIENGGFIEIVTKPVRASGIATLYTQLGNYISDKAQLAPLVDDPVGCTMPVDGPLVKLSNVYYVTEVTLRAMGQHSTFPFLIDSLCMAAGEKTKEKVATINTSLFTARAKGILCWVLDQNLGTAGYNVRTTFEKVLATVDPHEQLLIKNYIKDNDLKTPSHKGAEYPIKTLGSKKMVLFEDRSSKFLRASHDAQSAKSEFVVVMSSVNGEDVSAC